MRFLYLCEQGTKVSLEGERLVVTRDGEVKGQVHLFKIDSIFAFGNVNFTNPALTALLRQGVTTSLFTIHGRLKGCIVPFKSKNIDIRLKQFTLLKDSCFCLTLGKRIVKAKVANQIAVIRRFSYNHPEYNFSRTITALRRFSYACDKVQTLSSLMGVEGSATRAYFQAFSTMFRAQISFSKREKRPAPDPSNSLLSLGYVLLTREISGYLEACGLDPYFGFYHQIRYGRMSLALDLMEPFRQPVIDRFVLLLANKRIINPDDFQQAPEGVKLKDKPLRTYLAQYEKWLNRAHHGQEENCYRKIVFRHCAAFAKAVREGKVYEPFLFK